MSTPYPPIHGSPSTSPLHARPNVYVVDDDISVRESLDALIRCAGWRPAVFSSAEEFLSHPRIPSPSCLVLDVTLPELNGLDLQRRIAADLNEIPIIFITGYGNVAMAVQAMKAGAVEFLTKPFNDEVLLGAIGQAIERSRDVLGEQERIRAIRDRYGSLSLRERQVMDSVVRGLLNKQIGAELAISEVTVKAHRGRAMRKMRADSVVDLVNMAAALRPGAGAERASDWRKQPSYFVVTSPGVAPVAGGRASSCARRYTGDSPSRDSVPAL
jgi:FixJ family two-component response regulator